MAKVQQKSEKITAFGGIFFVLDKFDSILSSVIDSHLGLRSRLIGYQYSEIIRAVFSVFCCGGDCMEDLNLYLKDVLSERPHTRVPSADTVLRGIEELATENISYTAEKTGNVYITKGTVPLVSDILPYHPSEAKLLALNRPGIVLLSKALL